MANNGLSIVEFRLTIDARWPTQFEPFIDGTALADLVLTYESDQGFEPVGGYGGLVPGHHSFGDLAAYLRGEANGTWPEPGRVWLLGCDCGEAGCWPLEASLVVTDETVTWLDFAQPFRPAWSYAGFGAFVFDREQYDAAVDDLIARLNDIPT